jgi:hypothetical protein
MNSNLRSITGLMPPPAKPIGLERPWAVVEHELGTSLPSDYKEFIDTYGSGTCCEFIEVWNFRHASFFPRPIPEVLWGEKSVTSWYETVRSLGKHAWPYTMYPTSGGLLPFAVYAEIHHFNWRTVGVPDKWDIVYWFSDGQEFIHLQGEAFLDVLFKILRKEYKQYELPQIDGPCVFVPYSGVNT